MVSLDYITVFLLLCIRTRNVRCNYKHRQTYRYILLYILNPLSVYMIYIDYITYFHYSVLKHVMSEQMQPQTQTERDTQFSVYIYFYIKQCISVKYVFNLSIIRFFHYSVLEHVISEQMQPQAQTERYTLLLICIYIKYSISISY